MRLLGRIVSFNVPRSSESKYTNSRFKERILYGFFMVNLNALNNVSMHIADNIASPTFRCRQLSPTLNIKNNKIVFLYLLLNIY